MMHKENSYSESNNFEEFYTYVDDNTDLLDSSISTKYYIRYRFTRKYFK